MTVLKRIALAIFVLPLLFNAGFDVTSYVKSRAVGSLVSKTIGGLGGVAKVKIHGCYDIREQFWLCDVTVTTATGQSMRNVIPVPYEALKE